MKPTRVSLVVFTRFPEPGRAKTRLIPAVGAERAAAWQRKLTTLVVGRAWSYSATRAGVRLVVAYEGSTRKTMSDWLGELDFVKQATGDLGERMESAVQSERARGADAVILLGADCPGITEGIIDEAILALSGHPVVFGPAEDGGYYLLGLSENVPCLFEDVPWGGGDVLERSLAHLARAGVGSSLLKKSRDVDDVADLGPAEVALAESRTVSVIIPVLNEAERLAELLPVLAAGGPFEIIVVDGGSEDESAQIARDHGASVVDAPRGRALQMNAGAKFAKGQLLLFLHADTTPPSGYVELVADTLTAGVSAGAFSFSLDGSMRFQKAIEKLVAMRCRFLGMPYGDQGLFLRRTLFHEVGGFPEMPVVEDLEFVRSLRRVGQVRTISERALTSGRRWRDGGIFRTFLRHQGILLGYFLGASPRRLAKFRR